LPTLDELRRKPWASTRQADDTCQAALARAELLVEIEVTAAAMVLAP